MGDAVSTQSPVYGKADHSNHRAGVQSTICSSRGQKKSGAVITGDVASENEGSVLAQ